MAENVQVAVCFAAAVGVHVGVLALEWVLRIGRRQSRLLQKDVGVYDLGRIDPPKEVTRFQRRMQKG